MRLHGNSNNGGNSFIDVTSNAAKNGLVFRVNTAGGDTERMRITADGKVGIGTAFAGTSTVYDGYNLFVTLGIRTEKVKVDLASSNGWADFVFAKDYKLRPLSEVETFIKQNQHLPDVPSAQELEKNGMDLGEMHKIQMQKIEELTLYLLELKKENEELKKRVNELEKK